MRLAALVVVTLVAFAANSLLNRAALAGGGIGPGAFAAIRLASGAGMLWALVGLRGGGLAAAGPLRLWPAAAQLTVPVLAIAAGVVLLGEAPSVRMIAAGALVIGGVALSLTGRPR